MTLTITLPQGARRTARKKVLVKQLLAIEGFGSVEILCSDKTGTLTEGDIVLDRRVDLHGQDNENFLQFVYLNCHFQAGIKSPLDDAILTHEHPAITEHEKVDEIPFDQCALTTALFLDFLSHGFHRRLGSRLAAKRSGCRRPFRGLVRRSKIGGRLRGGGDIPGAGIFQSCFRAATPLRTVAMNGQQNTASPDSSGVPLGDIFGASLAGQQSQDPAQRTAGAGSCHTSQHRAGCDEWPQNRDGDGLNGNKACQRSAKQRTDWRSGCRPLQGLGSPLMTEIL